MDIATHALLGATAGYALGGRRFGRPAALAGALGASLPDLDVLLRNANDPLFTLEYHRHFSHSLIFAIGAAIVIGVILHRLLRKATVLDNILVVLAGYLSAILLDACTSYGTQLFWPFSGERVALSIISIVDPVFLAVLIICLWTALIRHKPGASIVALALCLGYLGFGALQQHRAESILEEWTGSRYPEFAERMVKPSFGNVLLWRGLAWNSRDIMAIAIRPGLIADTRIYPGERHARPTAQQLAAWSAGSTVRAMDVMRFETLSAELLVAHPSRPAMLGDARYALLPNSLEPLWGIEVNNSASNAHVDYVTNRKLTADRKTQFLDMLFARDP